MKGPGAEVAKWKSTSREKLLHFHIFGAFLRACFVWILSEVRHLSTCLILLSHWQRRAGCKVFSTLSRPFYCLFRLVYSLFYYVSFILWKWLNCLIKAGNMDEANEGYGCWWLRKRSSTKQSAWLHRPLKSDVVDMDCSNQRFARCRIRHLMGSRP